MVFRHDERVGNQRRDNSTADHGGDQERILGLVNDPVLESKEG